MACGRILASQKSTLSHSSRCCFSTSSVTNQDEERIRYPIVPRENHGPYLEYSVIHTDRSLNLMAPPFGTVMRDLNAVLKHTYQAHATAIIPG